MDCCAQSPGVCYGTERFVSTVCTHVPIAGTSRHTMRLDVNSSATDSHSRFTWSTSCLSRREMCAGESGTRSYSRCRYRKLECGTSRFFDRVCADCCSMVPRESRGNSCSTFPTCCRCPPTLTGVTQGLFVSVVTLIVTLYVLCIVAPMNAGTVQQYAVVHDTNHVLLYRVHIYVCRRGNNGNVMDNRSTLVKLTFRRYTTTVFFMHMRAFVTPYTYIEGPDLTRCRLLPARRYTWRRADFHSANDKCRASVKQYRCGKSNRKGPGISPPAPPPARGANSIVGNTQEGAGTGVGSLRAPGGNRLEHCRKLCRMPTTPNQTKAWGAECEKELEFVGRGNVPAHLSKRGGSGSEG